jgi:glycosyltransferase involved in cell wall biosynthesis
LTGTVLWWGRFDPEYSRNRILRHQLTELGWRIVDFRPRFSCLSDWEALAQRLPRPDLVWVPCFRHRDLAAASRWARSNNVPLLFDPLISSYDKQVFERGKIVEGSPKAAKLLKWERELFRSANILLADTREHACFFVDTLGVEAARVHVIFVGAEESLFMPAPPPDGGGRGPLEALFYGSFIPLQGAPVIVEAARRYAGPSLHWTLIGAGPELARCKQIAAGLANVSFEPWVDYAVLPERIRKADILLGAFGTTQKAGRVIPNKVFQALACGKPVVTREASAYPDSVRFGADSGLFWTPGGDASAVAQAVAVLAEHSEWLPMYGKQARTTFDAYFSEAIQCATLSGILDELPRH